MTNLNPHDYQNGQPVALAVGETVKSSSDQVHLGPAKAIAAVVATVIVAFLTALGVALQPVYDAAGEFVAGSTDVSGPEWVTIAIATVISTGLVGGATFATPTTVTGSR